jgi:hypothetical protein
MSWEREFDRVFILEGELELSFDSSCDEIGRGSYAGIGTLTES